MPIDTLGSLNHLLGEIYDAMRGVQLVIEELGKKRNADGDEPSLLLMASLTIDHAIKCQTELIPSASIDGADFRYDINGDTGKRIVFTGFASKAQQKRRYEEAKEAARKEQS